jgi:hypothetical protein
MRNDRLYSLNWELTGWLKPPVTLKTIFINRPAVMFSKNDVTVIIITVTFKPYFNGE